MINSGSIINAGLIIEGLLKLMVTFGRSAAHFLFLLSDPFCWILQMRRWMESDREAESGNSGSR